MNAVSAGRWHVLVIGGSYARPSHCRGLLDAATRSVARAGVHVSAWDISDRTLPPAEADRGDARSTNFVRAVECADAAIFVTPLHHNSFSGPVKNALDHLSCGDLRGKPIALMSVTRDMPSPQALDHLRDVVHALHGIALPSQVMATDREFALEEGRYEVTSPSLERRIQAVASELLWFAARLRPTAAGADATVPMTVIPGPGEQPPESDSCWHQRRKDPPAATAQEPQTACQGVARAVAFLEANFADSALSLDAVAHEAWMSRYHFSRTFKAQTGQGFSDFLTTLRLDRARALLANTAIPVTEICYAVGYRDLSNFERSFKKRLGSSPSEYRSASGAHPRPMRPPVAAPGWHPVAADRTRSA